MSAEIGFVYLFANDSMPGLYKIGFTLNSPSHRARELSRSTASPTEFDLLAYAEHEYPKEHECAVHQKFDGLRVNQNREFFRLSISQIEDVLSSLKDGALSYCEVNLQCHLFALRNASSTGKAVAFDDSAVFGGAE